jgi:hypothetical protein
MTLLAAAVLSMSPLLEDYNNGCTIEMTHKNSGA